MKHKNVSAIIKRKNVSSYYVNKIKGKDQKQIKEKTSKTKRPKFRYGYRDMFLCLSFLTF